MAGRNTGKPQQVTRIPPYRPGTWVKMKVSNEQWSEKVKRVKNLTASITSANQKSALWRVFFTDGSCVEWRSIARAATPTEIDAAEKRLNTAT